jgi:hypothetical protein
MFFFTIPKAGSIAVRAKYLFLMPGIRLIYFTFFAIIIKIKKSAFFSLLGR